MTRSTREERITRAIIREEIWFAGVYKISMYIFYPIVKQPIEPTSSLNVTMSFKALGLHSSTH